MSPREQPSGRIDGEVSSQPCHAVLDQFRPNNMTSRTLASHVTGVDRIKSWSGYFSESPKHTETPGSCPSSSPLYRRYVFLHPTYLRPPRRYDLQNSPTLSLHLSTSERFIGMCITPLEHDTFHPGQEFRHRDHPLVVCSLESCPIPTLSRPPVNCRRLRASSTCRSMVSASVFSK
jgi:hypothetical protein